MELGSHWRIIKDNISSLLNMEFDTSIFLTEDMFQAILNNLIIDSGWYENVFISFLIINNDWERPLMKIYSSNLEDVFIAIKSIEYYCQESSLGKSG